MNRRVLMKARIKYIFPVTCLLGALVFGLGCQSVNTTAGKLRNQEGNYEIAIDLLKRALADNPNDAEAYFQLGISYSNLDSVSLAYEHFVKSIELNPTKYEKNARNNIQHNFAKHYKLGQGAFKRDDFQTAAEEFLLSTKADPEQAVAFFNLGVSYSRLGEDDPSYYNKAIDALDKVLELSNPSESNYINALEVAGNCLVKTGREDDALERFNRLIEEDPTSYGVIENIGNDLLNDKQWKGAVVFLKMSAEARAKIGAEDFTLYYNIGAGLYNMSKQESGEVDEDIVDESIGYYEKALDIEPDEPQTIFNIVVAHVAKKDWDSAVLWGEKYVDTSPADSRGWQLLARCYSEMGDKDKARDALKKVEQLGQGGG
jgi:tetratricopeptide (TPR) repeat protein